VKLNLEKAEKPAIDLSNNDNQNIEVQPVKRAEIVVTEAKKGTTQPDLQESEQKSKADEVVEKTKIEL
jgi:hypothetical protein